MVFKPRQHWLTHWGRATHICVGKLTTIGSDNGLSPGRRQAIIWTIAGILLIGTLGTYFSEILIGIQTFSFKKMHLKMSSAKWRPFVKVIHHSRIGCESTDLEWILLKRVPWSLFSFLSVFLYHCLPALYHLYIWQVSPKLSGADICPIWPWFNGSKW